jgi:phosphate transport system substrate-binding protein
MTLEVCMKQSNKALILLVSGAIAATLPGAVWSQAARSYISIVGSSTVYPFATVVAEQFRWYRQIQDAEGRVHRHRWRHQAVLQSGVGVQYPDIANSLAAHQADSELQDLLPTA